MKIFRFSLRYLIRKRLQTFLLILGITLGVAVVVAIDFSNETAKNALDLSVQNLIGTATHQIIPSNNEIPEQFIVTLKRDYGFDKASPIVEGFVKLPVYQEKNMLLFGIDPLMDFGLRNIYGDQSTLMFSLINSISEKNSIIISKDTAEILSIQRNENIKIEFEGKHYNLRVVGIVSNEDPLIRRSLNSMFITDIATAQEIFNRTGFIDKIDVVLSNENQISEIKGKLPKDLFLVSKNDQKDQVENMVAAFQLNLTALSLLALVVGLFLIFNTMTFSVIQRRELIGVYRGFGFYRSEIFKIIIFEAFLVAVIGTTLGIFGGILLGRQTVNLILQTINDLYFTTIIQEVAITPMSIIKGILLGLFATIFVAIPPAIESTRVTPRNAALRSGLETKTRLSIPRMIQLMAGCFLFGSFLLINPIFKPNLWWAFLATFFIVVGFSLLTAICLNYLLPRLAKPVMKVFGLFPAMAIRELHRSLSRTGIAISSLMVAVSVTMGMTIMISSFRNTVEIWLTETLVGEIYLSVPNQFSNISTAEIDPNVLSEILKYPYIQSYNTLATMNQFTEAGSIQVDVITNERIGYERLFLKTSLNPNEIWNSLKNGSVLLSEPLANRLDLHVGDTLELNSKNGPVKFPIIGIFYDYASNQGHLIMEKESYLKNWDSYQISAVSLYLNPDKEIEDAVRELQIVNSKQIQKLIIRDNKTLQNDALAVFDRTFLITNALRFIATIIAMIGIYGAVLLILEDRKKEIGILKAIGVRSKEFWKLLLTETGLMGFFAGIFAIPTGIVISLILVYVINLRSFGWTIQFQLEIINLVQAILLSITSAIIAGIFPILRINHMETIKIIRNE